MTARTVSCPITMPLSTGARLGPGWPVRRLSIDTLAGHAVETFRNIEAFDLQLDSAPSRDLESLATAREFVARALYLEVDVAVHESRLVPGDDAVAVGPVRDVVGGAEFHQWHAAAGLFVDNSDLKVIALSGRQMHRQRHCCQIRI